MSPGGHLVTTVGACIGAATLTGSAEVTLGVAVGGFLIDLDHVADYVVVERQRDLRPGAFLRYYVEGRTRRAVLVLHSYELFVLLGALAWWTDVPLLWGYLMGALMHLALDIAFNGELTPRSIVAFYSFGYRLAHGFRMATLFGEDVFDTPPAGFWGAFFQGARAAVGRAAGSPGIDGGRIAAHTPGRSSRSGQ
jgi:hypothetical protein